MFFIRYTSTITSFQFISFPKLRLSSFFSFIITWLFRYCLQSWWISMVTTTSLLHVTLKCFALLFDLCFEHHVIDKHCMILFYFVHLLLFLLPFLFSTLVNFPPLRHSEKTCPTNISLPASPYCNNCLAVWSSWWLIISHTSATHGRQSRLVWQFGGFKNWFPDGVSYFPTTVLPAIHHHLLPTCDNSTE